MKFFPHLDDATGHHLDILFPFLEELGVVQDQSHQLRAISWGVPDLAKSEGGEATVNLTRDLCRRDDDMKGTNALAVQTSVLGETLADQQRDAASDEFPDSPSIPVQIAAGKTLIGTVEEGVVTLPYHHVRNPAPLFPGRIYAGRVVSTGVEEEDGTVWSVGEGGEEFVVSEAGSLGIVVLVSQRINSDVLEDSGMVRCKTGWNASVVSDALRDRH
jgi:hypothetical protein